MTLDAFLVGLQVVAPPRAALESQKGAGHGGTPTSASPSASVLLECHGQLSPSGSGRRRW